MLTKQICYYYGVLTLSFFSIYVEGFQKSNEENPSVRQATEKRELGLGKYFMISGTKWCGPANTAQSFDDLGNHTGVDKCCRSHDKCPLFVESWSSKYGYWNWRPYTVFECGCDRTFRKCLQDINTGKASEVEEIFFDIINPPCFKLEVKHEKVCTQRSWGFCVRYGRNKRLIAKLKS